jgi:hypothetical protein
MLSFHYNQKRQLLLEWRQRSHDKCFDRAEKEKTQLKQWNHDKQGFAWQIFDLPTHIVGVYYYLSGNCGGNESNMQRKRNGANIVWK